MTGEVERWSEEARVPSLSDPDMFIQDKNPFIQDSYRPKRPRYEEEEEPPDAYYAVSGDQEDYGYGDKGTHEPQGQRRMDEEDREPRRPPQPDRGRGHASQRFNPDFERPDWLDQRMRTHYRDRRYYGPGGEEHYFEEVNRGRPGEFGKDYIMSRGTRPDRYYGPGPREDHRDTSRSSRTNLEVYAESDAPYEGPTIFDKVFRQHTRKSSTEERVRSRSRSASPEPRRRLPKEAEGGADGELAAKLEAEWLKYKEKTENKIR